jgi:hypothetical protein
MGAIMSDTLSTAARYRERAHECLRLANLATDEQVRQYHRQMAENYLSLADRKLSQRTRREAETGAVTGPRNAAIKN